MTSCSSSICHRESKDDEANVIRYYKKLLGRLNDQRVQRGTDCNVVLVAEGRDFFAHRCVLSAACDFFQALDRSGMQETRQEKIELKGLTGIGLEVVMNFIYTGILAINEDNIGDVLHAVTHLQLPHALNICDEFMKDTLGPSNCVDILNKAELYSFENVRSTASNYIEKKFSALVDFGTYLNLSFEQLLKLVSSDSLRLSPEIRVFEAVCAWVNHVKSERIKYTGKLMEHVRFLTLPADKFIDVVLQKDLMVDCPACNDLIIEALKFFSLPTRQYSFQSQRRCIRNEPAMVCVNENMYIYNNRNARWLYLGCSMGTWKTLSQKFIVINNYLYACGGYSERNRETTRCCHRFDPQTGQWSSISTMIEKRQFFTLTGNEKIIAAVGGVYGDRGNFYATHPVQCPLEIYYIDENRWLPIQCHLPVLKWPGACIFSHFAFIVGGKYTEGRDNRLSHHSYLVDLNTGDVEERACPITPRFNSGLFFVNGRAVLFGGEDDKYRLAPCIEEYEFAQDTWTEIAQIPVSLSYQYISTSQLRNQKVFYLLEEHDGPSSESYVLKCASFDFTTRTFLAGATLPHPHAILASRWCSLIFPQEFFDRQDLEPPKDGKFAEIPNSNTTEGTSDNHGSFNPFLPTNSLDSEIDIESD